jgi:hypothetical protein
VTASETNRSEGSSLAPTSLSLLICHAVLCLSLSPSPMITALSSLLPSLVLSSTHSPPSSPTASGQTPSSSNPEIEGFKWSLTAFRQWLANREGQARCDEVWRAIDDVIIKTMIAAEPELTHSIYTGERSSLQSQFIVSVSPLSPSLLSGELSNQLF